MFFYFEVKDGTKYSWSMLRPKRMGREQGATEVKVSATIFIADFFIKFFFFQIVKNFGQKILSKNLKNKKVLEKVLSFDRWNCFVYFDFSLS